MIKYLFLTFKIKIIIIYADNSILECDFIIREFNENNFIKIIIIFN